MICVLPLHLFFFLLHLLHCSLLYNAGLWVSQLHSLYTMTGDYSVTSRREELKGCRKDWIKGDASFLLWSSIFSSFQTPLSIPWSLFRGPSTISETLPAWIVDDIFVALLWYINFCNFITYVLLLRVLVRVGELSIFSSASCQCWLVRDWRNFFVMVW